MAIPLTYVFYKNLQKISSYHEFCLMSWWWAWKYY